jgi:hypothetical protein
MFVFRLTRSFARKLPTKLQPAPPALNKTEQASGSPPANISQTGEDDIEAMIKDLKIPRRVLTKEFKAGLRKLKESGIADKIKEDVQTKADKGYSADKMMDELMGNYYEDFK